jgi:hypothetical protein
MIYTIPHDDAARFDLGPLVGYAGDGIAWVRFGEHGPGVSAKDTRGRHLLFSDRSGRRQLRIGWLQLRWLPAVETAQASACWSMP